ncbi:NAD(P)-binding protein [Aspergillus californicus]
MATIAVAGGTGRLGRAIVEALRDTTDHSILILARSVNDELSKTLNVPIIPVDYSDVESLSKILEEKNIDTVISTAPIFDPSGSQSQLNLIEAAIKSPNTRRFIPSEYGIIQTEAHAATFPPLQGKLDAVEKLRTSGLQYTLVSAGFFMDFYGLPKVKSYLEQFVFAVDVAHNVAAIPGSGDARAVWTHSFDIAKYVAALTNEETWPERSIIIGDTLSCNELLAMAEDVKGAKFDVKHDSVEKLNTFTITELPGHPPLYPFFPKEQLQYFLAVFSLWVAAGDFDLPDTDTLNKRFPDIKPRSMKELLRQAWKD